MVAARLSEVKERIAAAAMTAGRDPESVELVVVTKSRSTDEIEELLATGHRDLGENRAQELVAKAASLPDTVSWHFVGTLQRNKVTKVRPVVRLLHSMDSTRLARSWAASGAPPALLQVNIGGESQKHGVPAADAVRIAEEVIEAGVDLRGLMTVPPAASSPEQVRPYFAAMRALRDDLVANWPAATELSMGMTDDYEVAVLEGATIVRIGRAIFGPRNTSKR